MNHHLKPIVAVVVFIALLQCALTSAIVNNKIDRIIDLSSQLVKVVERIHIEDKVGLYKIIIEQSHRDRLAFIEASISGKALKLIEKPDGSYEVDLTGHDAKPLVVTGIYTKLLQPYPSEIRQADRQLVRYQGSQVTLSPYLTKASTTKIKLPQGSRLESFSRANKMTTGTNKLTYGPFKDVQPMQSDVLIIHYENNSPFVAVTSLLRTVELSPWSQAIKIVNEVKLAHVGAKLKGPFSRIDYQRDHSNGVSSVKVFGSELPRSARDIYFRDGIGNISTSNVRHTNVGTFVAIRPRFPLFGGWVTEFNLGYKVPIKDFLNEPASGNNYRLSVPFADILYDNMYVEDALLKIILPAGASGIEVVGATNFDRLPDEISYSYLDLFGRPVVVLRKSNIVAQHLDGKPLVLRFNYNKLYCCQEPLLLIGAVLATLILTTFYSKLHSKSTPATKHKAE